MELARQEQNLNNKQMLHSSKKLKSKQDFLNFKKKNKVNTNGKCKTVKREKKIRKEDHIEKRLKEIY